MLRTHSLHWSLILTCVGGCTALFVAPAQSSAYLVYVSNERSGDISVIDPVTKAVTETIVAGKRPRGIHCSSDGRRVYVALSGSPRMGPGADPERGRSMTADKSADGIGVIAALGRKVTGLLRVGSDPEQFALNRDGTRIIVSNEDIATATVVDLATGKRLARIAVAEEPEGVGVNPISGEIYVTCEGDGSVFVLDPNGERAVAQFTVPGRPRTVAFSRDGSQVFIPSEGANSVSVIDARAHRVLEKIDLPGDRTLPMGAAVSPDGSTLLVTTGRGNELAVIDLPSRRVVRMIAVGERPWGVALDPGGTVAYTANGASDDVSVVDLKTLNETTRIKVGKGPWGVAIGTKVE